MSTSAAEASGAAPRKAWSTPLVIVSAVSETQAHVTNNPPDGSSSGVQFGS